MSLALGQGIILQLYPMVLASNTIVAGVTFCTSLRFSLSTEYRTSVHSCPRLSDMLTSIPVQSYSVSSPLGPPPSSDDHLTASRYSPTSHSYTYPTQLIDLSPSSSETEVADNDICYIQRLQTYREANILCITNLVQISRLHKTPTPSHALLNSSLNFSTVSRNSFNSL